MLRTGGLLVLTVGFASGAYIQPFKRQVSPPTFDWSTITPSTELNWVDCYVAPLKCTRLTVPLNYSNPDDGTGAIALVSYPSPLANTPSYRGPVLYNPGGPGGSGVDTVVAAGVYFQSLLGQEFDIIGFDPRGVGKTTPELTFPGTPEEEAQFFENYHNLVDLNEASWPTLPERIEEIKAFARLSQTERGELLKHFTTDNVARDMLSIVRVHGREKLQYWGTSYGTVLGSTYASLFPENVERMILEGVVDLEGYYTHDWTMSLADSDKALEWFFTACFEAGSSCSFHAPTLDGIRARYNTVEALVHNGTITRSDGSILGVSLFEAIVHSMIYGSATFGPVFADALAQIELEHDGSLLLARLEESVGASPYSTIGLRCTDVGAVHDTVEELKEYARRLREASRYMPGAVEQVRLSCIGWEVDPDNFKGPFGANTSFPLMFVSTTADPATPLIAAEQASAKFPGSRVLAYDIPGHGILALPGNACVDKHYRDYMINGTLPEVGTVCEDDRSFFPDGETVQGKTSGVETERLRSLRSQRFI